MQALFCKKCSTIRTLRSDKAPTSCDCGTVWAWHESPLIARFYTQNPADRRFAKVIEMSNTFITEVMDIEHAAMYADPQIDTLHRSAHQRSTIQPLFGFDNSRRSCWATFNEVGTTRYSGWSSVAEAESKAAKFDMELSDFAPTDTDALIAV